LIGYETVVSTRIARTQGLGADHNPMRVCGLGGGVGGDDACGIWEFLLPERAAGPPTHPHCRYPSPFLHLKLGPGDDRAEISCR
jgi:hypothetical protein